MVAALQGGSRTLLLLSLGARAALATDVTACSGSATTECINMDTCVVNIQGANYDLKPLQQAEGNKAEGADQYSPPPVRCPTSSPAGYHVHAPASDAGDPARS